MFIQTLPGELPRLRAAQLRGARALLGLSLVELASAAGVSVSAVLRAERGEGGHKPAQPQAGATRALRVAFEARGIRFLESDDGTFGVALGGGAAQPPDEAP